MACLVRRLVLVCALSLSVSAHMEMRWPYAFRSKFNPNNTDPDYDNTSPLLSDGSNYPCKGFQDLTSSQAPVITYTSGQTYNLTLAGTATHGGGSCQISLSYDDGQTFHVLKSMVGGCPLKLDWDFTIPSYAPPSNSAILAWTWFNLIGNREMYMNCARVAITGQAVQRYRRTSSKRQTSIDQLPENFACNIGNGCSTIEDHEVVFPNPGSIIEPGTDLYSPLPGPGYSLTATPTGSGFSNASTTTTKSLVPTYTTGPYFNGTNCTTSFLGATGTGTGTGYLMPTACTTSALLTVSSNSLQTSYNTSVVTITTMVPTTITFDTTVTATITALPSS